MYKRQQPIFRAYFSQPQDGGPLADPDHGKADRQIDHELSLLSPKEAAAKFQALKLSPESQARALTRMAQSVSKHRANAIMAVMEPEHLTAALAHMSINLCVVESSPPRGVSLQCYRAGLAGRSPNQDLPTQALALGRCGGAEELEARAREHDPHLSLMHF